jgi:hypothetical protein
MCQDGSHTPDTNAILKIDPAGEAQQPALTVGGAKALVILLIFVCGGSSRNQKSCPIISCDCRLKTDKLVLCSLVAELLRWSDIDLIW